jgi:hypothetical protein
LRLEVPDEHLDSSIKLIQEYVPLVLTELLLNMNESSFSDGEERKPKDVLIPIEGQATTLHCPKKRKIRDQTLVYCVTAVGDAYCPFLISAQPVAREMFKYQIRDGIGLEIEITHSPYATSEILIMF